MKLKLPNGDKIILDTSLPLEERKKVVDEILKEWNEYFESSWELNKTKVCLEILSNYLCLVKDGEEKNTEDKHVLSLRRTREMKKGSSKISNFSSLPNEHKQLFGLVDYRDEEMGD